MAMSEAEVAAVRERPLYRAAVWLVRIAALAWLFLAGYLVLQGADGNKAAPPAALLVPLAIAIVALAAGVVLFLGCVAAGRTGAGRWKGDSAAASAFRRDIYPSVRR
jgi:hypothetical protein